VPTAANPTDRLARHRSPSAFAAARSGRQGAGCAAVAAAAAAAASAMGARGTEPKLLEAPSRSGGEALGGWGFGGGGAGRKRNGKDQIGQVFGLRAKIGGLKGQKGRCPDLFRKNSDRATQWFAHSTMGTLGLGSPLRQKMDTIHKENSNVEDMLMDFVHNSYL
jgi:hypothetical protein